MRFKTEEIECTASHSPGYKVGGVYKIHTDEKGRYLEADDGYKDYLKDLVSSFKEYNKPKDTKRLSVVVK